jgi:hypothetical protein
MWLLVIVFLELTGHDAVLETFQTQQDCLIERDRVGFEMAASYPDTHDFNIVCELKTVQA